MTRPDSAHLAAIHAAAFNTDRAWTAAEIEDLLHSDTVHAIAERTGFGLIRVVLDEAELLTIAVHPDGQRQGLGTVLATRAIELAASLGAETMFLEVAADNAAAIGLYLKLGFAQSGIRKGYYARAAQVAVDAVLMKTKLTHGQGVDSQGNQPKTG